MLSEAEPRVHRGDLDVVQSVIENRSVYEPDMDLTDQEAQAVLDHLLGKVKHLLEKMEGVPTASRPDALSWIIRDVHELLTAGRRALTSDRHRGYGARHRQGDNGPPSEAIVRHYTSRRFPSDFDRFLEDALLLGELTEQGDHLADLMRLDLWSSRPQLYEIWIMLTVLGWLRGRGYRIELLKIEHRPTGVPFRWDLSYAKDSQPCAVVTSTEGGSHFLFYQLYRPSGDMPDISLLAGPRGDAKAGWSIDPKHSEAGGYSANDYRATAERYRDSFGAQLSLVVEYFDRGDLGLNNPTDYGVGAHFIHSCSPEGGGRDLLFAKLEPIHPALPGTLVCVDFSSSFDSQRDQVLQELRRQVLQARGECVDEVICFAGSAVPRPGFRDWLHRGRDVFQGLSLASGTRARPLLEAVKELISRYPVSDVVLVTDGGFDVDCQKVADEIGASHGIPVRFFPNGCPIR